MKKILLVSMAVILVFTLSACGKKKTTSTQGEGEGQQNAQEVTLTYTIKNRFNTYSLYSNGDVYAKGTNKCGELGLGHKVEMPNETKIEGLSGITKIVLQQNEDKGAAYFINALGEVYVTGYNAHGQLGLGHTNDVIVPTKIEGLVGIVDIEISEYNECNTFFINQNGKVYVSGANSNGELGIGHKNQVTTPVKLESLNDKAIKKVVYAEGFKYALFLDDRGEVFVSGSPEIVNQKPDETASVQQSDGSILDGILNKDGNNQQEKTVTSENVNKDSATEEQKQTTNFNAPTIPTKITALNGINVVDIVDEGDAKKFMIFLIADSGDVYGIGYNKGGVLGVKTSYNKIDEDKNEYISVVTPQKVMALDGIKIKGKIDKKFIGMNDEKYEIISGDIPRAKQVK